MKFSLSYALPLLALASAAKSAAAAEEINEYTTFNIIGVTGDMPSEETEYFQDMFVDTYNLVHGYAEGAQVEAETFVVESQGEPTNRRGLRAESPTQRKLPGNWSGGYFGGRCSVCFRRDLGEEDDRELEGTIPGDTAELHRRFEKTLGGVLREGPYSYFEDVSEVVVAFGA